MKNKKLVFLLLPLACAVWGVVMYRIMQAFDNSSDQVDVEQQEIPKAIVTEKVLPDTFSLMLGYKDPFLNGVRKDPPVIFQPISLPPKSAPVVKSNTSPESAVAPEWPQVEYMGLIENKVQRTKVAMVSIGGVHHLLQEGQVVKRVRVLEVMKDSMKVSFGKEVKCISLHKNTQ